MTERAKKLLLLYYKQSRKIRRVSGLPPLTFKAKKAGTLKDYRIYGNTAGGESVGDRTGNLWDEVVEQGSFNGADGTETVALNNRVRSKNVTLGVGNYTISANGVDAVIVMMYLIDGTYARSESIANFHNLPFSFSLDAERIIRFAFKKNDNSGILPSDISNMMLNSGSTALPYEPYGYKVPVTVEGKNLLPNTATSQTINGVTFTVNGDGSVTCNGTALQSIELTLVTTFSLLAGNYRLIGTPSSGSGSSYFLRAWYSNSGPTVWIYDTGNGYNFTLTDVATMRSSIVIRPGQVLDNITFYPMIRKADIEDDTYEPYHAPVTTPIYLPEQIRKVGDEAEYISYSERKLHRVGADDIDVTLPALPVLPGTNTLTVGTEVQPSSVEIKGRIKAAGGD